MMNGVLGLLGEFADPAVEAEFKRSSIEGRRRLCQILALMVLVGSVLLAGNDSPVGAVARVVMGSSALAVFIVVSIFRGIRIVTTAMFALAAVVLIPELILQVMRPEQDVLYIGLDLLMIFGVYMALPGSVRAIIVASGFSVALVAIHWLCKDPVYALTVAAIPVALLIGNFLGAGIAVLLKRVRRLRYWQAIEERGIREELEQKEQEVRRLSSMLPMCAGCKKVRNDEGFWEQVETFMSQVEGARVLRGVCPDCAEQTGEGGSVSG
ncbi:MAG: hypothetical protein U5O39_06840 [Gammaproteobacteria bacterium]|nr:hypothetical protein [Gammaproteobacteria bacterium]